MLLLLQEGQTPALTDAHGPVRCLRTGVTGARNIIKVKPLTEEIAKDRP